ncbi:MAG: hypothetical protein ACT4QE_10540 [Anaerolineales bacterium]
MGLSRDLRWMGLSLVPWGLGDGLFFYLRPLFLKELDADPQTIGLVLALAAAALGHNGPAVSSHSPSMPNSASSRAF